MTHADDHEPRRPGRPAEDETEAYVIDTRRSRRRVSAPRNPLGGSARRTGGPRQERPDREPDQDERGEGSPTHPRQGSPEARPGAADPGRTRLMTSDPADPTAPDRPRPPARPGRPGGPGRPAGGRRPGGPSGRGASAVPRPRRRRRRPPVLALAALALLAWLAFLVVTPLHAWSTVSNVDTTPAGERPARVKGYNYLLVGSDSRQGMTAEEEKALSTGDAEGQRTDSIILVHVSETGQRSAMVSLPRDSYVPIPGHRKNKINAAFALGGPKLLVATVEGVTGVHVDGYVEIGFGGFAKVVDSLGGVDIDVPFAMNDEKAGINLKKGPQTLDGAQALGFVRSRYTDPEGDLGRAKRQRQFLGAIMHKAVSPATVLLPWRYWGFSHAAAGGVKVGEGTGIGDLTKVMQALRGASSGDTLSLVVPISDPGYHTAAGDAVKWDSEKARAFFGAIKNDEAVR